MYTEKKSEVEHQLGTRVVKDLTEDLQEKWHHAYFDKNFYHTQPTGGSRKERDLWMWNCLEGQMYFP